MDLRTDDPYRILLDHVSAGAARCRLGAGGGLEVLDRNAAFAALCAAMPGLLDALAQAHRLGPSELEIAGRSLAVSCFSAVGDEVMIIVEDVTERRELERRARASENRFEQAFHGNAAAMVIAHRSDLRIVDVNPRWLEMFGATRAQVIGRTAVELGLISPGRARTRIAQHLESTEGYETELQLQTLAGQPLTVLASAKPIEIAEGICTLTTLIDISGRKIAEAALRELNVELERRVLERTQDLETTNRDLEAFTSSVSHDLRAPLRTIHGFSGILLEDFAAGLPAEAMELLAKIHTSGDRLRNLIDELLAFSQLGRNGVRRSEIDLDPLVHAVVDELLAGRGLEGRIDIRVRPLGRCSADPGLLRPVWTNLIDNALKYSRDRARIVIEIGCDVRGGETVYYVRDNGVGFDMAYADRLFGVFQRLHSASEFEGTGVGLANVRRIVERHHGRVAATSEVGVGSTFEFTLGMDVP